MGKRKYNHDLNQRRRLAIMIIRRQAYVPDKYHELWFAVLVRAITDLGLTHDGDGNFIAAIDTTAWFKSGRHDELCHLLEIDPDFVIWVLNKADLFVKVEKKKVANFGKKAA